jgi:putative tricarboxylic transport membrane protein
MEKQKSFGFGILIVLVIALAVNCGGSSQGGATSADSSSAAWRIPDNTTFLAGAGVGGGIDTFARSVARALNVSGTVKETITVENMLGGGGLKCIQTVNESMSGRGDILYSASGGLVSLELANNLKLKQSDMTPIARMVVETMCMVVGANNKDLDTVEKFVARMKSDPGSINFGGDMPPAQDYLSLVTICTILSIDPAAVNYVHYDGDYLVALMGGSLDISFSGASEWTAAIEAGQVKCLAVAGEKRLDGIFANVPTFREKGIDFLWQNWRAVMGPPNMPKEAVAFWQDALRKAVDTKEWKETVEKIQYEPGFMVEGFPEFMKDFEQKCSTAMKAAKIIQ